MQNDTNTYGYNQWFYFSIRGTKSKQKYIFKIANFVILCLFREKIIHFFQKECRSICSHYSKAREKRQDGLWLVPDISTIRLIFNRVVINIILYNFKSNFSTKMISS